MIYIGADHNGFWLKEELKSYLESHKLPFKDMGAFKHVKADDYPVYASKVVKHMGPSDIGILLCGSGHGMAIAANKFKGIRAAMATSIFSAQKSREDDHANVLVLSAWETSVEKAKRVVAAWISAKPSKAGRHLRRVNQIRKFEK